MDNPIENLNKIFDNQVRLGIMSILLNNPAIHFNDLKKLIEITDGNLASNLKTLEENKLIKAEKEITGKKMNTTYTITKQGKTIFQNHLDGLEKLVRSIE